MFCVNNSAIIALSAMILSLTLSIRDTMARRLPDAEFEEGDTVLVPFMPIPGFLNRPYHAFRAVSTVYLLSVAKTNFYMKSKNRSSMLSKYQLPCVMRVAKCETVKPDEKKCPIDKAQGTILAWRMSRTVNLPYRLMHCNCRHYCDYLTYGRTFGSYRTFGYWPMSEDCPLYAPIHPNTDVASDSFQLLDKKGKAYPLAKYKPGEKSYQVLDDCCPRCWPNKKKPPSRTSSRSSPVDRSTSSSVINSPS